MVDTEATRMQSRALILRHAGRDYVVPPDFNGLFSIGRSNSCQITLDSSIVSRLHGCIRVTGGTYVYRDTSSNGTVIIDGHDEILVHEAEIALPDAGALKVADVMLHFSCRE